MMGLLDNIDDPRTQAILSMGFGLLNSRGNLGQGIGQAGPQALQAFQQAKQAQQQKAMQAQQMEAQQLQMQASRHQLAELQRQASEKDRLSRLAAGSVISPQQGAMAANGGPTMAAAGAVGSMPQGFDWQKYSTGLAGINPMEALKIQAAMKKEMPKLSKLEPMRGPDGKMVNIAVFDDGTTKVLPYGVRPDIAMQNLGDKVVAIDKNDLQGGASFGLGVSPDTRLQVGATVRGQDMSAGSAAAGRAQADRHFNERQQSPQGDMKPPSGYRFKADGTLETIPGGPAANGKGLTESQGKATAYLGQMRAAEETLAQLGGSQDTLKGQVGVALARGGANIMAGPKSQQVNQAQEQWAESFLRFKTGAAATEAEVKRNINTFFPKFGDGKDVVLQKARMREQAMADIGIVAGTGADKAEVIPSIRERTKPAPKVWDVQDGYRFKGGDPGDPKNWEKVK